MRVYRFNKDSEKRTSVFDSKSGQSNRLGKWMGFFSFLVLGLANIIFKETNQYIWFIPPPTKHLLQNTFRLIKKSYYICPNSSLDFKIPGKPIKMGSISFPLYDIIIFSKLIFSIKVSCCVKSRYRSVKVL